MTDTYAPTPLRLSVLDQTPVGEGHSPAEALRASVELAEALDAQGFTRYWLAEHHNSPGFAGTAPEILAGQLLARTRNMRIGTGGVLLPRYSALKVAEVFRVLAALHPGRVDLGLGRAGGPAQRFPEQVSDVRRLLGMDQDEDSTTAAGGAPAPQMWLLGAGTRSAELAGKLGTSFAFAHFLAPTPGRAALESYRRELAGSSPGQRAGTGVLAVRAVVADTDAKADELAQSLLLWRSRKDLGQDLPMPSLHTTRHHRWTGDEVERAAVNGRSLVYGTPERVHARLTELAAVHGVGEIVVNTLTHDPADRLRSYSLLSEAFALTAGVRESLAA
jgi:luciferase family oxidoreductase group 1